MSSVSIELEADRAVYRPDQTVRGRVRLSTSDAGTGTIPAQIRLRVHGQVVLNLSPKAVGLFEAFYSSLRPIIILDRTLMLSRTTPAAIYHDDLNDDDNVVEYPFEFDLEQEGEECPGLISSYKGRMIHVQYALDVYTGRTFLPSGPRASRPLIVTAFGMKSDQRPNRAPFKSHGFCQSQGENEAQVDLEVDLEGVIDNTFCSIMDELFQGEITIQRSTKQITSITATLNRIETCEYSEGAYTDKSEVQTVEVAVGNVCRGVPIPIQMPWPRVRACPSISHADFSVGFEVELRVHFVTGQYMVERIPVRLY